MINKLNEERVKEILERILSARYGCKVKVTRVKEGS